MSVRISSGVRFSWPGTRSRRPLTRMTGGDPAVRWRSDASRSTVTVSRSSTEWMVLLSMVTSSSGRRSPLSRCTIPQALSRTRRSGDALERPRTGENDLAGDRLSLLEGRGSPEWFGRAVGPGRDVAARDAAGAGGERGPDDDSVLAADRHVEAVVVTARAGDRREELHAAVVADEAHRGREARAGAGGGVVALEDVPLAV